MCKRILPTSTITNIRRTVRRTCLLVLGLKGLTQHPASYFNFTYHPTSRENHVELLTAVPENVVKNLSTVESRTTKLTTPMRTSICCTSCLSLVNACFILTKGPASKQADTLSWRFC